MSGAVLFELNEVPWKVVDWWTAMHPSGGLADLVTNSRCYTTASPDEGELSPWITWPTVHRGVPNTEHGIGWLGQDLAPADAVAPPWWRTARDAGIGVGVFGSLHAGLDGDDGAGYDFFVPDTFAPSPGTVPPSLEPFQAFNLAMARESVRNVSSRIDRPTASRFIAAAPRLGLRPATVGHVVAQLAAERRVPERRVRRRTFQAVVGFDLYLALARDRRPQLSSFFTNHVASAMHRYWAATFPEDYDRSTFGFDLDWVRRWRHELGFAMGHADRMVRDLLRLCRVTGDQLVVASSMGQQAAQGTPVRRQLRLADVGRFLTRIEIADPADVEVLPAMAPDVAVRLRTPTAARALGTVLDDVQIGGVPLSWQDDHHGSVTMRFGHADDAIGAVVVAGSAVPLAELGLVVDEIEDEAASSGYHVAEGVLAIFDPARPSRSAAVSGRPSVSTTQLNPYLHRLVGVEIPAHCVDDGSALEPVSPIGGTSAPRSR